MPAKKKQSSKKVPPGPKLVQVKLDPKVYALLEHKAETTKGLGVTPYVRQLIYQDVIGKGANGG